MTELQVISRVLNQKSVSLLELNSITEDYFLSYKDEYKYIMGHYKEYGNVPDKETFLSVFPEFDIVEVAESDKYLIDTLEEEHLYSITVPVLNKVSELIQTDSNAAVEYIQSQLPKLVGKTSVTGIDIISQAKERFELWKKLRDNPDMYFIPTGFKEIDEKIGGFNKLGEEFAVVFARTGVGKTWVAIKMMEYAWRGHNRIGLLEPEMTSGKVGYRFDTVHAHISNTALTHGYEISDYENYIESLSKSDTPFFVSHPRDFKRKVTVSKLRSYVIANKIDMLVIDGISYLTDERKEKGDSRTTQLTNISEDLMDLSIDLHIPVIVVCQSNREGAKEDDLHIENIRDSDGISYNASLIFAIQQKDPGLQISILKNRNGENNLKYTYLWDIDLGQFKYIPSEDNSRDDSEDSESARRSYKDTGDTF